MGALDKRLYTSHHTPTALSDCVKMALHGCSDLPSTVRLSFQSNRTYNPHPCTVLPEAHNIHTRPPDAPARLAYQRTLMNPYCMSDLADLASARAQVAFPLHTQRGWRRPPWCWTPRHVRPGRHHNSGPWWLQFSRISPSPRRRSRPCFLAFFSFL